jgi:hypothetical protein
MRSLTFNKEDESSVNTRAYCRVSLQSDNLNHHLPSASFGFGVESPQRDRGLGSSFTVVLRFLDFCGLNTQNRVNLDPDTFEWIYSRTGLGPKDGFIIPCSFCFCDHFQQEGKMLGT